MAKKKAATKVPHHHAPKKRKKKAPKISALSFSFQTGAYYKDGKQVWPKE